MVDLKEQLTAQVPDLMRKYNVPGLSLALISAGRVAWQQAFGVQNTETNEPVDLDTVFEAASLSKPVVTYQALKLCSGRNSIRLCATPDPM